ncbi:MAG: hypothetical protein QXF12_03480 [Candidatus Aenigmatarchaeota archaeon]
MINLPHMFIIFTNNGGETEEIREKVIFRTELEENQLNDFDIVIDILNGKIVSSKVRINDEENFISEYMKKYSDQIVEIVRSYFAKNKDTLWKELQMIGRKLEKENMILEKKQKKKKSNV